MRTVEVHPYVSSTHCPDCKAAHFRSWYRRSGGEQGAKARRQQRLARLATFTADPVRYPTHLRGYVVDVETGTVYGRHLSPVGSVNPQGYVTINRNGSIQAHRVVWEAANGPIPQGLEINHRNGDKADNRLANLEVVTHQENILHAYATGLKTNAGTKHPSARLTESQVYEIRRRYDAGETAVAIAADFPVGRRSVSDIGTRHTWSHLPEVHT